ncbi:MAG: hypothetical protein ABEK50_02165 [bacterium]
MKTPRRTVEFSVERWKIEEKGYTTPPYLIRCELIWPRPRIENRKTVLPLPNRVGEDVDWTDVPLKKKLLFKEDIEGSFVFSISVLPLDDEGDVDLGEAGDLLGRSFARESSVTWRTLSDLMDLGTSMASYLLSGPQKVIAAGEKSLHELSKDTIKIPLNSPNELQNPEPDPAPEDHRPSDDHQEILKKPGDQNGYMDVKLTVWEE